MTPEEAREAAAVMLAWADGKKIERKNGIGWHPCPHPIWDWDCIKYRVAAEPWQGKIWVHPDGNIQFSYPTIDAEKWTQGGWRLITVKEVTDEAS